MKRIDLNCDMGEGTGLDPDIMPLISSCNIACGGHTGDETSMAETVQLALKNNVKIGAHPSYPDEEHFGRKTMQISKKELKQSLKKQVENLQEEVKKQGGVIHHFKPHGALYNDLKNDKQRARIVIETILEINPGLKLVVPPYSAIKELAERELKIKVEGFADRNYESDFSLVSRSSDNAVLKDKEAVFQQVLNMALHNKVISKDGEELFYSFDTICVHSDTPNSLEILSFLHEKLPERNVVIKA